MDDSFLQTLRCLLLLSLLVISVPARLAAMPPALPDGTDEAAKAKAAFRAPQGLKVELYAAEPQLGNPVAICLDEQGRVYVAEEYRFNQGTEENRTRPFLLEDDLQLQTLDDRLAMFRKFADKFEGGMDWFTRQSDQVRLLEDRDGDGRADHSTVFADGFNQPLDGLAAGLLAHDGDIFLTCIPNLWRLRDADGDGKADERQIVHHGFGVNAGFLGHDLHGLVWGPDGKLYFSVGDRGFHVETREGQLLHGPRTGAVFRCLPDGSELEVVHRGLRNPQELAFDDFGNLFADDNNCDKGDHARLVYIVDGGESGWNMAFQTIPEPYLTGPWHAEKLWHMPHAGQPAWIVPSVGALGAGPSGFTFYSGVGLPERYRSHFFMCNYTGNGGIESFAVKPKGAGFEIVDYHDFLKPIMATDVEFGYDGKMYVSDFVKLEWNGPGGCGRVYTLSDPALRDDPLIRQTRELFKTGFTQRSLEELAALLRHADRRVRLRAQFALAERGEAAINVLSSIAKQAPTAGEQLARLHAVWGLGQIGRAHPAALEAVAGLLNDDDAEVRAQAARTLGDRHYLPAAEKVAELLTDGSPRVKFFAALAIGRMQYKPALDRVFELAAANEDRDPFLRHAAVMALVGIGDVETLQARTRDARPAVRMAVLLAERRLADERIVQFLDDAEAPIVAEAARAIHDLPIDSQLPALARLAERFAKSAVPAELDPLVRRTISANFRLGGDEQARAVIALASNPQLSSAMRAEALGALGDWQLPAPRDRVTGFWRPLPQRDPAVVRAALEAGLPELLANLSGDLETKAAELATALGAKVDYETFFAWVGDRERSAGTRSAALRLLAARKAPQLRQALDMSLQDPEVRLRAVALDLLVATDASQAETRVTALLANSDAATLERQAAVATLARLKTATADALLADWATKLAKDEVPPELQLDVFEAATARDIPNIRQLVADISSAAAARAPLGPHRMALAGGDADRGKAIFRGHLQAQCVRCHKVERDGGTAGPELTKVAERNPREHLLESLIEPNAKIAPGFGSLTLVLADGTLIAGTIKSENTESVSLETPDGKTLTVPIADIEERSAAQSPMPSMAKVLAPRELRDLIEYLSTLK